VIRRLLIANRGEIALRVIRACREMGIETVAVYSDADVHARHMRAADFAVRLGPASPLESYLNIEAFLAAARATGADAIHPGYGFLSENAAFAEGCARAGILFVGPPPEAMTQMGSKIAARALMMRAGVPVVPGQTPADQTDAGIAAAGQAMGFPVLVKASAGGGGKGMRTATSVEELGEAIPAARREAASSFGDGTLYIERRIERPRHIEVQVFADAHGNVIHLFERECSIQRRHQKVIEESPSPAVSGRLRAQLGEAATAAARAVGYRNAGTIEFLLEGEGDAARFYFLEMNTRLQVEHGITEAVTGTDLVRAQLAVAAGAPLPWRQEQVAQRGHAIECRVYAEDPSNGFLPQAGTLRLYREPSGPGVRIDSGVEEGADVPVQYDPLLAKLIASAENRDAAIARVIAALRQFPVLGVRTNIGWLIRTLWHDDFRAGRITTRFVDQHAESLARTRPPSPAVLAAAAVASTQGMSTTDQRARPTAVADPWSTLRGWGR